MDKRRAYGHVYCGTLQANGDLRVQGQRLRRIDTRAKGGEEVLAEVRAGIEFAKESPTPDPDTLLDDVYA